MVSLSLVQAAQKNRCDFIDAASVELIKKCQSEHGLSAYAKEQNEKKSLDLATSQSATAEEAKQKSNLEIKKFGKDELLEASYGKPFIAVRIDYRTRPAKEKRITEGSALCKYLGFEKSIKAEFSENLSPEIVDKKGLIINTSLIGQASKEPDLYSDEELKFEARTYVSISCVKRKDAKLEGSDNVMKKFTEETSIVSVGRVGATNPQKTEVDDRSREGKEDSAYGYKRPEYMKDGAGAAAK